MSNPSGYCQCGCGGVTPLATKTRSGRGDRKGEPVRYIEGHNARKKPPKWERRDCGYLTPCWIWIGTTNPRGYGWLNKKFAHVTHWESAYGDVPEDQELHHLCEQTSCVNIHHLVPLTRREHIWRHHVRVTPEMADEIRKSSDSQRKLAARLGIGKTSVARVRQGKSWMDWEGGR